MEINFENNLIFLLFITKALLIAALVKGLSFTKSPKKDILFFFKPVNLFTLFFTLFFIMTIIVKLFFINIFEFYNYLIIIDCIYFNFLVIIYLNNKNNKV